MRPNDGRHPVLRSKSQIDVREGVEVSGAGDRVKVPARRRWPYRTGSALRRLIGLCHSEWDLSSSGGRLPGEQLGVRLLSYQPLRKPLCCVSLHLPDGRVRQVSKVISASNPMRTRLDRIFPPSTGKPVDQNPAG